MSKFSLAIVRQRYAADGGAERFVARALETLTAQGVAVTLLARQWRGDSGHQTVTCNPFHLGRLWRDWSFARCVCATLRARRFDLVQSHERLACCDIYRAGDGVHREWLAQRARVLGPLGRLGQALNPYHLYVKRAEAGLFASPRLKAVICNSPMVRDEIKRYFAVADAKLHVIYNGVDTEAFHPRLKQHRAEIRARHGIPPDAPLFLFVGSGFERKGVGALLKALAALPGNAWLLVVGRDKRIGKYRARARALGIGPRAIFAGRQAGVKPYYGAADALVLPTLYDPFPNVVLEAMAAALPVITTHGCGAAELIEKSGCGYVCDALDVAALTWAMRALMDSHRAAQAGAAARAAAEPLGLERMAGELLTLYERLLAPS
jgi:UDP-glucose:(heptosyl)LPS alpha-1,3-glucosyltransferase